MNALFAKMLAAATARPVIAAGTSASGTSIGAALLAADGDLPAEPRADVEAIASPGPEWEAYAAGWRERAACRRIGCP